MKRVLVILSALVCIFSITTFARAASNVPPYRIASMKAYLFYETKGTFSKDIFQLPGGSLWNTVIGEGASGGASDSTMVVIEINGTPGAYQSERKLELIATENGKVIFQKTSGITVIGDNGKYFLAFWLYNVGMSPIKISAKIIGQSTNSLLQKTIPFASGE